MTRRAPWGKVEKALKGAKAIAWDGCHKIYVLQDDEQVALMEGYGYDPLILAGDTTPVEMLATLKEWYERSCSLRFIQAVRTAENDPNDGFEDLISQFEDEGDPDYGG